MARKIILPARFPGDNVQVQTYLYPNGQTFKRGALMVLRSDGNAEESAADPTTAIILGIAGADVDTNPGFGIGHSPSVVTGREQSVSIFKANRFTEFSGRAVNAGTDPVVPTVTHIGESYGMLKTASDGTWTIDIAETTAKLIVITDVDIPNDLFIFKFLEALLATP